MGNGVDYALAVNALPSEIHQEFKTVIYNAKPTPNGDYKFRAKTYNVSNPKSNILDLKKFVQYLWSNYQKQLRKFEFVDIFDEEVSVGGLLNHMFESNKNSTDVDRKSLAASAHLNWSSASGSKIEQARSQQYWKVNEKDVEFLKYIKVAYAVSSVVLLPVRCPRNLPAGSR